MPAGKSKETYTHGYSDATTTILNMRTAEKEAAFFLPHLKKGMRLLDCGCGTGSITQGLAKAVAPGKAVGIDFAESQTEIAKDGAARNGVKNLEFRVGDVYEIPFPDGSFNAVYSHTLLEHLKTPDKAIKEMLRVLKPGGVLGARSSMASSIRNSPPSRYRSRLLEFNYKNMRKNGGDPDFGAIQSGLFRRAGLQRVVTTTGTLQYGAAFWQKVWKVSPKEEQERLRSRGVPEEEIRPILAGISRWSRIPDAFWSGMLAETVGWKPKK